METKDDEDDEDFLSGHILRLPPPAAAFEQLKRGLRVGCVLPGGCANIERGGRDPSVAMETYFWVVGAQEPSRGEGREKGPREGDGASRSRYA